MTQTASLSEPVSKQAGHNEDEIELIDVFRVLWKWKYLIICGAVICALASLVISSILPKIYRIETLIRPGILSFSEDGKSVYIDTPENIKTLIEYGTFDFKILSDLTKSNGSNIPNALQFKVTLPKSSNSLQIFYETPQIEQGVETLNLLGRFLKEEYSRHVEFFQNEVDNNLNIARAEIQKNRAIKRSNEINIKNIEKRIHELETRTVFVTENTAYLNKERSRLLLNEKDESNILTAILFSNTIQQNLQLENDYENEIKNFKLEKESQLQNISELENEIQIQIAEINNLQLKKDNVQNIQILKPPTSNAPLVGPNKKRIVILAALAGLFSMFVLSYLLEYIVKHKVIIQRNF